MLLLLLRQLCILLYSLDKFQYFNLNRVGGSNVCLVFCFFIFLVGIDFLENSIFDIFDFFQKLCSNYVGLMICRATHGFLFNCTKIEMGSFKIIFKIGRDLLFKEYDHEEFLNIYDCFFFRGPWPP